jgi:DNA-directed RNA polymerase specialized sigma24 family protein
MEHPDQRYIDALVSNDSRLIKEIYQKSAPKIKWMVIKNGGNDEDSQTIFNDALIYLYQRGKDKSFRLTCPLDALLHVICKRKWIDELKKRGRGGVTFVDLEGYTNIGADVFKVAEEMETLEGRMNLLYRNLAKLSESCQNITARRWTGKPWEKIARELNTTQGFARKKNCECIARLIKLIKDDPDFNNLKW